MTGRELILYILSNDLEDEPVYNNGSFIGYLSVVQAAMRLDVGTATIYVLMSQKKLDYIKIGGRYFISETTLTNYERSNDNA